MVIVIPGIVINLPGRAMLDNNRAIGVPLEPEGTYIADRKVVHVMCPTGLCARQPRTTALSTLSAADGPHTVLPPGTMISSTSFSKANCCATTRFRSPGHNGPNPCLLAPSRYSNR